MKVKVYNHTKLQSFAIRKICKKVTKRHQKADGIIIDIHDGMLFIRLSYIEEGLMIKWAWSFDYYIDTDGDFHMYNIKRSYIESFI